MASRNRSATQNDTSGSSAQRSNDRELVAQYSQGKKFKVKCLGSKEMEEFRPGDPAAKAIIRKLRQESAKSKVSKPKVTITLKLKQLSVYDEKSKTDLLVVDIRKVKLVCHHHKDASVFAVIIQLETDGRVVYKLFCFQAEQKVSVSCVQSLNEVFKLVHKIMQARRQQEEAERAAAAKREKRAESPESDDTPINLGFGIPAPPPSYKAAISVKNTDKYKIPEGVQSSPALISLAPPPQSSSNHRSTNRPRHQTTQTTPTVVGLQPPPRSQATSRPRSRTQQSSSQPVELQRAVSEQSALSASLQATSGQQMDSTQDVWSEWRSLEGELQSVAQETGIDMNSPEASGGQVDFSIGFNESPFADNFFQTSFGSPSSSLTTSQPNAGAVDSFSSVSEHPFLSISTPQTPSSNTNQWTEDPFSSSGVSQTAAPISSTPIDPFSNISASTPARTAETVLTDPFSSISTPTTTNAVASGFDSGNDFGSHFAQNGETAFESSFTEPSTTASTPIPAPARPTPRKRPSSRPSNSTATHSPVKSISFDISLSTGASTQKPNPTPRKKLLSSSSVASSQVQTTPAPFGNSSSGSTVANPVSQAKTLASPPQVITAPSFGSDFSGSTNLFEPSTMPAASVQAPVGQSTMQVISSEPPKAPYTSANTIPSIKPAAENTASLLLGPPKSASSSRSRPRGRQVSDLSNTPTSATNSIAAVPFSSAAILEVSHLNRPAFQPAPSFPTDQSIAALQPVDQNWTASNFQPLSENLGQSPYPYTQPMGPNTAQSDFPISLSWGGNSFEQQAIASGPRCDLQQTDYPLKQQPANINPQAMYQFPVAQESPVAPPLNDSGVYSPPQSNSFVGQNPMMNNPFAGDFSSPPYAIHSSTPQSPPREANPQLQVVSPPAPVPKYDGPDVFAQLIPLVLPPPPKEDPPPPPEPVETPDHEEVKPVKKPTLNELYKEKHRLEGKQAHTPKNEPETVGQPFDNHFCGNSSSSWIAF